MDNVAFCFIVKDGDKYLEKNLMKIINFGDLYLDNYRIYYVENDSVDKTNEILDKFEKKYKNINGKHLKLDGKHSTDLCNKFDERMAYFNFITRLETPHTKWDDILDKNNIRNIFDTVFSLFICELFLKNNKQSHNQEDVVKFFKSIIDFHQAENKKKYSIIYKN